MESVFFFTKLHKNTQEDVLHWLPDKKTGRLVCKAWQKYIDEKLLMQGGLSLHLDGTEVNQLTGEFSPLIRQLDFSSIEAYKRRPWTHHDIRSLELRSVDFAATPLSTLLVNCSRLEKLTIGYSCSGINGSQLWDAKPLLPHLTSLELQEGSQEMIVAALTAFPALSELALPYDAEVDPFLRLINCSKLKEMRWLGPVPWTAEAIYSLSRRAIALQEFSPKATEPGGIEVLEQLGRLPHLRKLTIPDVKEEGLYDLDKTFSSFHLLTDISLGGKFCYKSLATIGKHCTQLGSLSLEDGFPTQLQIDQAAQVKWVGLKQLMIDNLSNAEDNALNLDLKQWIAQIPQLHTLYIWDDQPILLGDTPQLKECEGYLAKVQCEWTKLSQLTRIVYDNNHINGKVASQLLSLPNLDCVYIPLISDSNLGNVLSTLSSLMALRELDLHSINDLDFLAITNGCPNLVTLNVREVDQTLGESLVQQTNIRPSLQEIRFSQTTDKGIKEICRVYPNLKRFYFEKTSLTDQGLAHINWPQLEVLRFSSDGATEQGLRGLLSKAKRLMELDWQEAPSELKSHLYWTLGIKC